MRGRNNNNNNEQPTAFLQHHVDVDEEGNNNTTSRSNNNNNNNDDSAPASFLQHHVDGMDGEVASEVFSEQQDLENNNNNAIKSMGYMKYVACFALIAVVITVPVVIYTFSHRAETSKFRDEYMTLANNVKHNIESNLVQRLEETTSLATAMTSYAMSNNETWPFVTMPDFDLSASSLIEDGLMVFFLPRVKEEERFYWEDYSVGEASEWYQQAQANNMKLPDNSNTTTISDSIFHYEDNNNCERITMEEGVGPYFPIWQHVPASSTIVNFNLHSSETTITTKTSRDIKAGMDALLASQQPVIGMVANLSVASQPCGLRQYYRAVLDQQDTFEGEPISTLFVPVFDRVENNDDAERQVVGMLQTTLVWQTIFQNVVNVSSTNEEESASVVLVVENMCGDAFSYDINYHQGHVYMGGEVLHDRTYAQMEEYLDFGSIPQEGEDHHLSRNFCPYHIRIFPTAGLEEKHVSFRPIIFTFVAFIVFITIFFGLSTRLGNQ